MRKDFGRVQTGVSKLGYIRYLADHKRQGYTILVVL